ncbi:MAG: hypothetical protein R2779_00475 [Crocinitomicaceae bacterium]
MENIEPTVILVYNQFAGERHGFILLEKLLPTEIIERRCFYFTLWDIILH